MQNQAKLAAGAHRGYMAKHTSKCLHYFAAAMPAAALRAAAILGGGFAQSNPPPNICGENLNLLTEIFIIPKNVTTPHPYLRPLPPGDENFLPNPSFPYDVDFK